MMMISSRNIGNRLRNAILHMVVPVAAAFLVDTLGAPWYVSVFTLILAPYWYGPVLVYYRTRMPMISSLQAIVDGSERPPAHGEFLDKTIALLQEMGFTHLGRLAFDDQRQSTVTTASILQHPETSDIAHVMIATKEGYARTAEMVVFSRTRTDGSRIFTLGSTIQSPFSPNPDDSSLRVDGAIPLRDLWGVHSVRVADDAMSRVNDTVTNVQHFQTAWEREGVRRHIASGYWLQDEHPGFLRPTARGALFMCLRMLLPWKQISRIRARMEFRRLLYESRRRSASYRA